MLALLCHVCCPPLPTHTHVLWYPQTTRAHTHPHPLTFTAHPHPPTPHPHPPPPPARLGMQPWPQEDLFVQYGVWRDAITAVVRVEAPESGDGCGTFALSVMPPGRYTATQQQTRTGAPGIAPGQLLWQPCESLDVGGPRTRLFVLMCCSALNHMHAGAVSRLKPVTAYTYTQKPSHATAVHACFC